MKLRMSETNEVEPRSRQIGQVRSKPTPDVANWHDQGIGKAVSGVTASMHGEIQH